MQHVLEFGVVKLKSEGGRRKADLYLRCKATEHSDVDFTGNEGVLTSFCFPLGPEAVPPKEYMASEEFTFTLTYGDGRRFQGFCRKFLPPPPKVGSKLRYPQVIFLIAEFPWCTFYFKVLQVLEQLVKAGESLLESDLRQLPPASPAAAFLRELGKQVALPTTPGQVIKVPFPKTASMMGISPPRLLGLSGPGDSLAWSEEQLELQVPPDCGNGRWNCGISLARLLWHVPVSAMLTLLASMLMERRIILVGQARDTVTAAVQAASALLYPFKWHHIYLPMLPRSFMDYLTAPMPYMVGLPAQMLPMLKGIPMDEVTMIDLDLGKCDPAPGSARDDARLLPWRDALEAALTAVHKNIRSPTEYETSPMIAGVMQEYFCRLFGSYRRFIHEDSPAAAAHWASVMSPYGQGPPSQGATAMPSPRGARDVGSTSGHRRDGSDLARTSRGAGGNAHNHQDEALKGSGRVFEQAAFVESHRRNERLRAFLAAFRHSQMYEVFVQERLKMAAGVSVDPDVLLFEDRLDGFLDARRARKEAARSRAAPASQSKWRNMMNRHRRTDSEEQTGVVGKAVGLLGASIRRITTEPQSLSGEASPQFDPASFFPPDDDDGPDPDTPGSPGDSQIGGGRAGSMYGGARPGGMRGNASSDSLARSSVGQPAAHSRLDPHSGPGGVAGQQHVDQHGMTVTVASDGHRVYEGSVGDMVKGMWSDVKSAIKGASGSPTNPQVQSGGSQLFSLLGGAPSSSSASISGAPGVGGGAASTPGYRKQLTGDGKPSRGAGLMARYMPQTTGDRNLLDGSKLRMPPPPSRPLAVLQPALEEAAAESSAASATTSSTMQHAPSMTTLPAAGAEGGAQPAAPATGNLLGVDDFDGFAALAGRVTQENVGQAAKQVSLLDL